LFQEPTMVTERAELPIASGREAEFERQFPAAGALIRQAPGCQSVALSRGVENSSKYLLLVQWNTLEDHRAFARSDALVRFRDLVGAFFAGKPATEHFQPLLSL
jgi:heme-degrading monooxygenase HmoA